MSEASGKSSAVRMVGWALFLACSWTWVIGMWLPNYLLKDLGWAGYIAFFVPNVLGAAMMGIALRKRGASEAFAVRHERASWWFSVWTVVFHIAWLAALSTGWLYPFGGAAWAAGVLVPVGIALALAEMNSRGWRIASWVVFPLSLVFAFLMWQTTPGNAGLSLPPMDGKLSWTAAALAAPTMIFGFAMCPYLDRTFHRARQESHGAEGTGAFVLGFGVFFAAMILLTALYAGGLRQGIVSYYLIAHILVQATFTMGAHLRELLNAQGASSALRPKRLGRMVIGVAALMAAGYFITRAGELRPGYRWSQLYYEMFLSGYALVFPAIVWGAVIARGGRGGMSDGARRRVMWASVVIAAPMYAAGFMLHRHEWMAVGATVLVLAPVVARRALGTPR